MCDWCCVGSLWLLSCVYVCTVWVGCLPSNTHTHTHLSLVLFEFSVLVCLCLAHCPSLSLSLPIDRPICFALCFRFFFSLTPTKLAIDFHRKIFCLVSLLIQLLLGFCFSQCVLALNEEDQWPTKSNSVEICWTQSPNGKRLLYTNEETS